MMTNRPSYILSNKPFQRSGSYVKSPFRYPGGKFYALAYILPFILCVPHDEYREPFVGGGSVFFAKPKVPVNWINDLELEVINTYRIMADPVSRHELARLAAADVATRERHAQVKTMNVASELDSAFKTFYLNRTSYSGIIHKPAWGYKDSKSAPPASWSGFVEEAGEKLEQVIITALDFEEVILAQPRGKTVFLYLDPPYFHADQKRAYTKPFELEDHIRLARVLSNTTHHFCLSYDDCEEIRQLYDWAEIYEASWLYNTANLNGVARKMGRELIITNYHVEKYASVQGNLL